MKFRNLFNYGNTSKQRRKDVSEYLIATSDRALGCSPIDFGVPLDGGLRIATRQNWLFEKGWSKADGFEKLSFHQKVDDEGKGQALDLVPYIKGLGLDYEAEGRFGMIIMLMLEAWEELQEEGFIPNDLYLHCGGLWGNKNNDLSRLGWDLAHYEIRDYEQIQRLI